jgi:peptide/nickel transport system permease protein
MTLTTSAQEAVRQQVDRARPVSRSRNWALYLGTVGTSLFLITAFGAPLLAPYGRDKMDTRAPLVSFRSAHLLGTDQYGRDTLSRVLYAGQVSLVVAIIAVGIGLLGGTIVGLVAGYRGGRLDAVLMRLMDLLFSFPAILLAIIVMARLGSSMTNAMIAIGIIFIPGFARLSRSLTRGVRQEKFIEYARGTGIPVRRILVRDVLPNAIPSLLVQATVALGTAITLEAALSFLGLGAQPPTPSWGNMINAGRTFMSTSPLMVLGPGIAILVTVLSLNLLGDGVQTWLSQPKTNERS